jgi:hypothetical protein
MARAALEVLGVESSAKGDRIGPYQITVQGGVETVYRAKRILISLRRLAR